MDIETLPQDFNDLRARVLAGETVTIDEYKSIITALSEHRLALMAVQPKAKAKSKASKLSPEEQSKALDDLLGL